MRLQGKVWLFRALIAIPYLLAVGFYFHHLGLEWDTGRLLVQTRASLACISRGQWTGCRAGDSFPLLQKIPAALGAALGLKNGLIIRLLAVLNSLFCVLLFRAAWRSLAGRSRVLPWFLGAALLFGPFLWYARSSFSEALAACVTLGLVIACADGWSGGWIFLLAVLAGFSKDTAFPFLLVLGWLAIRMRRWGPREAKRRPGAAVGLVGGIAASTLLNLGHNYFRFGGWLNESYLDPIHRTPDLATQASFFLALLFSPNGGLILFWPVSIAILIYPLRRARLVPLSCLALLGALLAGFSAWAHPFGWVCWGPRFLIPWIPALVFLVLVAEPDRFERLADGLTEKHRLLWAGAALIVVAFPQMEALYSRPLVDWLFLPDEICPIEPRVDLNKVYYLRCVEHQAWGHPSVLLHAFDWSLYPEGFLLACAACVCLAHFLFLAWKSWSRVGN